MDTGIFALRLRDARTKKGFKQKELAETVGVRPASISAYENIDPEKRKVPSLDKAIELAEVLDVSLDWLCGIDKVNQQSFENPEVFFRMLVQLKDEDSVGVFDGFNTAFFYDKEINQSIKYSFLAFRGSLVSDFINAYRLLFELHKKGDLNDELYKTCIDGLVNQYSDKIDVADWVSNPRKNFKPPFDINTTDELPF